MCCKYDRCREDCSGVAGRALPVHRWVVAEIEKREQIWVDRLIERTVAKGLLICGLYHPFSVAAKLLNRGFEVEARTYLPWNKLGLNPRAKCQVKPRHQTYTAN